MEKSTIIAVAGGLAAGAAIFILAMQQAEIPPSETISDSIAVEDVPAPEMITSESTEEALVMSIAREEILFCADWIKPGSACVTREEVLALQGEPLFKRELGLAIENRQTDASPMQLELIDPGDLNVPAKTIVSCKGFNELKALNWGPLTSAGMADEQWFIARCGIFALAEQADTYERSDFADYKLTTDDLERIGATAWPYFGEEPKAAVSDIRAEQDGIWVVSHGNMQSVLTQISHADFSADGRADILILMNSRAVGGTASMTSYAVIEKSDAGVSLRVLGLY